MTFKTLVATAAVMAIVVPLAFAAQTPEQSCEDRSEGCDADIREAALAEKRAYGAQIFAEKCSLCHGPKGMGDGAVSLLIEDYPSTNLVEPKHGTSRQDVRTVIYLGGNAAHVDEKMPPWADELTCKGLESVIDFVLWLRTDTNAALAQLRQAALKLEPTLKKGREIYLSRCVLCHGVAGGGDGKLSAFIKDPPPFNLTKSDASDVYLRSIISQGGKAMGRSERMPAWSDEIIGGELESLMLYVKTLRE